MALSKHMQRGLNYSAFKPVSIEGSFEPNGSSNPTILYGNGFTVARTGTGLINVTLAEIPRRVIGLGVDIMYSAFIGNNPVRCICYGYSAGVMNIATALNTSGSWAAFDVPLDSVNHNNRISFWVECDESSANIR